MAACTGRKYKKVSTVYPFINAYEDGGQLVIGSPEATKVKNTRSQVLLTLGLRF